MPGRKFNDKPIYKQVDGDDYIYFWHWDIDDGGGHNWLVRWEKTSAKIHFRAMIFNSNEYFLEYGSTYK